MDEEIKDLRERAEQGDVEAQYELGERYLSGNGDDMDYHEAAKWLRMAYGQGNEDVIDLLEEYDIETDFDDENLLSSFYYHCIYNDGEGDVYFYKMAVKEGVNDWWNPGDDDEHVDTFIKVMCKSCVEAAERGDAKAQMIYGLLCYCGSSTASIKLDSKEAVKWWIKAAEQGEAEALEFLKMIKNVTKIPAVRYSSEYNYKKYYGGDLFVFGTAESVEKYMEWYEYAAKIGYEGFLNDMDPELDIETDPEFAQKGNAIINIGMAYYYGIGVDKDYNAAAKWLKKVAEHNGEVKRMLGECYFNLQDYDEAHVWFTKAASVGDKKAQRILNNWNDSKLGAITNESQNVAEASLGKQVEQAIDDSQIPTASPHKDNNKTNTGTHRQTNRQTKKKSKPFSFKKKMRSTARMIKRTISKVFKCYYD